MATLTEGSRKSFKTAADLSTKQWYIVKVSAANTVNLASAATDKLLGVLATTGKSSGDTAEVLLRNSAGTAKVVAGGSISIGDALTSDSNGKAVATTTSGDQILGYAITAGSSGDTVEFMPSTAKY